MTMNTLPRWVRPHRFFYGQESISHSHRLLKKIGILFGRWSRGMSRCSRRWDDSTFSTLEHLHRTEMLLKSCIATTSTEHDPIWMFVQGAIEFQTSHCCISGAFFSRFLTFKASKDWMEEKREIIHWMAALAFWWRPAKYEKRLLTCRVPVRCNSHTKQKDFFHTQKAVELRDEIAL